MPLQSSRWSLRWNFLRVTKVELLEDVQFLVRHAGTVMPPDPKEITGIGVKSSMLALQKDMTEARQRYQHHEESIYLSIYLSVREGGRFLYSDQTIIFILFGQ